MKPKDQNYSKSRRLKNQIKAVVTNPYNLIVLIAIVLLTYLIVFPLLDMISTSFTLAQKDARRAAQRDRSHCITGSACSAAH